MVNRLILLRQKLIINKLSIRPHSWDDIASMLENYVEYEGEHISISQRQFQRQIKEIRELWSISIKYNRTKNQYYIDDTSQESMRYREALDIFTLMDLSGQQSQHIIFEKRKPLGTENIPAILKAIKNDQTVHFFYKKFYESYDEQRSVKPLFVKESNNRWYIVGYDLDKQDLRVFGIDRVHHLTIGKKFKTALDLTDTYQLFKHCFGIILPAKNDQVEEVILSYTGFQGQYIKTMPLHESQEVLVDNDEEVRVRLRLYVTRDLIMEILSVGAQVRVLVPQSLADTVRAKHQKAMDL